MARKKRTAWIKQNIYRGVNVESTADKKQWRINGKKYPLELDKFHGASHSEALRHDIIELANQARWSRKEFSAILKIKYSGKLSFSTISQTITDSLNRRYVLRTGAKDAFLVKRKAENGNEIICLSSDKHWHSKALRAFRAWRNELREREKRILTD